MPGFPPYGCGDGRFPRFRPARLLAEVERIAAYRELVAFVHRIIDALGDSGDPDSRAPRQFVGGDDVVGGPCPSRRDRGLRLRVGSAQAVPVIVDDGERGDQVIDGGFQVVPDGERAFRIAGIIHAVAVAVCHGEVVEARRASQSEGPAKLGTLPSPRALRSPAPGFSDDEALST